MTEDIKHYQANLDEQSLDFETSKACMQANSEKRAWMVAIGAVVMCVASWIGMSMMMPLKEIVPYLVRVDNATGVTDIVSLMKDQVVNYEDIQDKYWIAKFIRAREGYNWFTLQSDYDLVPKLSSRSVALEYAELFQGDSALDTTWKNKFKADIKILNISPNGSGSASVRFVKNVKVVETGADNQPPSYWIATVNYKYNGDFKMKESERLINPFGFTVISYRVDPEMGVAQ
jgi:type IV secretion system protein VirB8